MEQQEPRRRTLKRRVQSFIYRVVPSLDAAQGAQRYRQYIKSSEKEILDLLAFEQVASLMGSPSDFDDIKERKQYLKERVAAQLQSGELNMAELKRMDKQVRDFCLEVAKEWQLTAAEGDGAAEEPRPRLKRCLERMWTRLSLDKNR